MITVVGLGQPCKSDDAIGWRLVEALPSREGVRKVTMRDDMTGLLQILEDSSAVLLVDAVRSGAAPATVHRLDPRQAPVEPAARFSSHALSPLEVVELARRLGRSLPNRLVLLAVEAADISPGTALSEPLRASFEAILQKLEEEVELLYRGD